nr:hypothetical protein [uncultured Leptotrichia sp.]
MAKLTKFKEHQVEYPSHYRVREQTTRGDAEIKVITPEFGKIRVQGTAEKEEIYNGLQLGSVHTLHATKTTDLGIDYYVCELDGLDEFGLNKDLKIRLTVDSENKNDNPKLRLNRNDYVLLKEFNEQIEIVGINDLKQNKTYELTYNGTQFVIINILNYATEQKNGIAKIYSETESESTAEKVKEVVKAGNGDTQEVVNERPTGETVWSKLIKTLDHTKILSVRGLVKILSKFLKPATENEFGLVNFQTIKQVSPKPDLTPYVPFSKGYRVKDNTTEFVRSNGVDLWSARHHYMYDEAGNYMGAYHLNGGRAYYKVPNRNGGNWCEIMDNHDMAARDNRMNSMDADRGNLWGRANNAWDKANDAQVNRIYEIRLAGYITLPFKQIPTERNGYVVTGIWNDDNDIDDRDFIQMRILQFHRNGQWLNAYFA